MKKLLIVLLFVMIVVAIPTIAGTDRVFAITEATCAVANPPPECRSSVYQVDIGPLPHANANPAKVTAILTVVFTIIGALSLLMVTIGGFRYINSQGDPQAIAKAKNTIMYAIIGILVSISAVAIVTFVIGRA